MEPELRSEMPHDKWEQYFQTQRKMKAMGKFRLDLLEDALKRLHAMKTVTLTWTRCPWEEDGEVNRVFNADVSIQMAKNDEIRTIEHGVLSELAAAHASLQTLNLEPLRRYESPDTDQGGRTLLYKGLRRLVVVLDRSLDGRLENELTRLLRHPNLFELAELRLESLPWVRITSEAAFLSEVQLSYLQVLELIRPEMGLACLAKFLGRQAQTLKKLKLIGIKGIRQTSHEDDDEREPFPFEHASTADNGEVESRTTWQDVFEIIHNTCKSLNIVKIADVFTDPIGGGQVLFYETEEDIDLENMPSIVRLAPAKPIEVYLLGKGHMPALDFSTIEMLEEALA